MSSEINPHIYHETTSDRGGETTHRGRTVLTAEAPVRSAAQTWALRANITERPHPTGRAGGKERCERGGRGGLGRSWERKTETILFIMTNGHGSTNSSLPERLRLRCRLCAEQCHALKPHPPSNPRTERPS